METRNRGRCFVSCSEVTLAPQTVDDAGKVWQTGRKWSSQVTFLPATFGYGEGSKEKLGLLWVKFGGFARFGTPGSGGRGT